MKDEEEQIRNLSPANKEAIALYAAYYFQHIQKIEQAARRKAFLDLLLQVASNLYGPETGLSLGFSLLAESMQPNEMVKEGGEYRIG